MAFALGAGAANWTRPSVNTFSCRFDSVLINHGETGEVSLSDAEQEFVHEAIHGLRDPLTICRLQLQMLDEVGEAQREKLALVLGELDRMARIMSDLQLLADAADPSFLRPEWIDLELFAHELTAEASTLAPREWRLDHSGGGTFFGDRRHLAEAMMSLARNALAHTDPHETIAIETSLSRDECRLSVRDTGPGITKADRVRIFDPFARGTDAHRRYRGAGLGLSIVKAIAEAHGGRVELETRPGEGATFTLVLPRHPSKARALGAARGAREDAALARAQPLLGS
jgi:two-component system, OmpR family, sensor kinase